ncbi:MAG: hypothetical protein ACMUHU_05440 [Thermoplasmatota archaeon]
MKIDRNIYGTFMTAFLLLTAGFILLGGKDDMEVEAAKSPTTDTAGYAWIDSRDPTPKTTFNWIDATGGTLTSLNGDDTVTSVSIPFQFPFYGNLYTTCHPSSNGLLGIHESSSSLSNTGIPSTSSPNGFVSPYWDDISVYQSYGAYCYTIAGTDPTTGEQYFCIEWYHAACPYYYYGSSSYEITFEVLLYNSGRIKIQYLDAYTAYSGYDYGGSATVGIESPDGSTGLQYSYNSRGLADGLAIEFRQFATELSNVTFATGYGPDENVYPAQGGMGDFLYWAEAKVYIESDVEDLTNIDMVIGSESEDGITLRYDFQMEQFRKLNDGSRVMILDEERSNIAYHQDNPRHNLTVRYYFDFNFNWMRIDTLDVRFAVQGIGVRSSFANFQDVFRVETRMMMDGNITITDIKGRELEKGAWVKGGDSLTFSGVVRKYADPSIPIAPPEVIGIGVADSTGKVHMGKTPDLMDAKVFVPAFYNSMEFWLVFINVTKTNDMSSPYHQGFRFLVQIDSDKPGLPGELVIRPDSFNDQQRSYDDDTDVYLSWKDAVDVSSGVLEYHITANMDRDEARSRNGQIIDIPKGTLTALIENLEEGVNTIYIWAEDAVGNEGNSIFIDVIIDLTPGYFTDFYPVTGAWINTLRPRCSIVVHDDLTGIDPLTIEYEVSTSGEVGLVGEWNTISDPYAPSDEIRLVVEGWFKNGKDNWIRFRAKDMAGNGFTESEAYNVWVDAKSPTFKLLSHSEEEYQLNTMQEIRIQILDEQSWVDSSSIEYRVTTQGQTKWSQWLPYKDASDGPKPVVTLREHLRRGSDNFVQVRAKDLAGNPIATSKAFNIRVNTYPVIVVVSPTSGDRLTEGDMIIFDASDSYDADGDRLTISWFKSSTTGMVSLGESPQIAAKLPAGEHTITVIAKDRVNNQVQATFSISVEKVVLIIDGVVDTDQDGVPDAWEEKFQTDPNVKDAHMDPDGDGFNNLQEYRNNTNPQNKLSKPPIPPSQKEDDTIGLLSTEAWPIWALFGVLTISVLLTMAVVKSKKDRQLKRIKSVRNLRKIMPSVSWDHITTTAYMAPMTGGMALSTAGGPALPSAPMEMPADQMLPPAPFPEQH